VGSDSERYARRAQVLWPRLDPAKLRRTLGEPERIARLVARRTALPAEAIVRVLLADDPKPPAHPRRPTLAGIGRASVRPSAAADAPTASRSIPLRPGQLR
jgi:hypothetical protein